MDKRFEELLTEYVQSEANPERCATIEEILWREFGHTKAVFVMDMSGFSLLTQKYGIIHYLSLVKRMQVVTRPLIESLGGVVVKFEADNCFAAFDDVLPAVQAAFALNKIFDEMNLKTDKRSDILVSIGIDYGDVLLIGAPDYFGNTVNRASKLGEDVAEAGEILLTTEAYQRLPVEAGYRGDPVDLTISGIQLQIIKLDTHP